MSIYVKILSATGSQGSCKDGGNNIGNHQAGSQWAEMDFYFMSWAGRNIGKEYTMQEFRDIYIGLLMTSGFSYDYGVKMSCMAQLKRAPVYAGFIEIFETDPVVMESVLEPAVA